MTLPLIVTQMAKIEGAITGLSTGQCFDVAPNMIQVSLPAVLNMPRAGTVERFEGLGHREITHTIDVMCLVAAPGSDLPTGETLARPFVKRFLDAFDLHQTFNGTATGNRITSWRYGEVVMRPGEPGYLGIVFTTEVDESDEGTLFSA